MCGLHGFLHNAQQVLPQLAQVHFAAQRGAEHLYGLGCIILPTVKAPVDELLNTMAQGVEENIDCQSGDDNGHAAVLADDATQQPLQSNDETKLD